MAKSLAEQLAKFANPEPEDFDPEDLERNSDASQSENEEARSHYVDVGKSRLRDDAPEVHSTKYKGARVSRKDLEANHDSKFSNEEEESSEDDEEESMGSESSGDEDLSTGSEDENVEEEDSVSEDSGSESENGFDQTPSVSNGSSKSAAVAAILQQEQKQLISKLSQTAQADVAKGKAVQAQMLVYEGLLDARIRLQKALSISNTLTQSESEPAEEAFEAVLLLLESISKIRRTFSKEPFEKKKRTFEDFVAEAEEADSILRDRRENILGKWSRKVQLSSGASALQSSKFKSLSQSAATQVTTVLADTDRLVKRTRVNRSQYQLDGAVPDESDAIFDDTDFYRLLLKDLVDRRMAESGSAGLKWSTTKTKTKKNVDTKASKGRKLRYHVQEKVQGFDAPRDVFTWTDDQAEELFSHLLGQSISMDDKEPEEEIEVGDLPLFA